MHGYTVLLLQWTLNCAEAIISIYYSVYQNFMREGGIFSLYQWPVNLAGSVEGDKVPLFCQRKRRCTEPVKPAFSCWISMIHLAWEAYWRRGCTIAKKVTNSYERDYRDSQQGRVSLCSTFCRWWCSINSYSLQTRICGRLKELLSCCNRLRITKQNSGACLPCRSQAQVQYDKLKTLSPLYASPNLPVWISPEFIGLMLVIFNCQNHILSSFH